MPLERLGTPFSFFPDTPSGTGPNGGVTRTDTSLTQLSGGAVALGYTGILPGVVEIFDPATGTETRDNVVLSSTYSAFGGTFFQDTPDVDVAALGTGFVAVWIEAVGTISPFVTENRLRLQSFDADGTPVSTQVEVNLNDNQFPADVTVWPTSAGVAVSYRSDNDENTVQFYDSALSPLGSPIVTDGAQPPELVSLSNGQVAVLQETEGTPGSIARPPGPDSVEISVYDPATGLAVVAPFELSVARTGRSLTDTDLAGITALEGGGFAVLVRTSYDNGSAVFFDVETFNNDGTTTSSVPSPREIDFGVPTTALGQVNVIGLPGGGYAIVYERKIGRAHV